MKLDARSLLARERLDRIIKLQKEGRIMFKPGEFFEVDAKTLRSTELLAQFIKQKGGGKKK